MMLSDELAQDNQSQTQNNEDKVVKCEHGHKLYVYVNGFKRIEKENGEIVQPKATSHKCKVCKQTFNVTSADKGGFLSCKETCNWFSCQPCLSCMYCSRTWSVMEGITPDY